MELYREKYQAMQKGLIGFVILMNWGIPLTNKSADIAATQRYIDFEVGWFLDPIFHGDYPLGMRNIVGSRLPSFTKEQLRKLQGSLDFIGINHYFALYCHDVPRKGSSNLRDFFQDMSVGVSTSSAKQNGTTVNSGTSLFGIPISPEAMQSVLEYVKCKYHNPPVIVYESGFAEPNNDSIPLPNALDDQYRIDLHLDVLKYVLAAIRNGSDTRGYFVWALLDNFEALCSYTWRFGLHYVDFDNLNRYPKLSAQWYKTFLHVRDNKRPNIEINVLLGSINATAVSPRMRF